jgi:hypothetical protein
MRKKMLFIFALHLMGGCASTKDDAEADKAPRAAVERPFHLGSHRDL